MSVLLLPPSSLLNPPRFTVTLVMQFFRLAPWPIDLPTETLDLPVRNPLRQAFELDHKLPHPSLRNLKLHFRRILVSQSSKFALRFGEEVNEEHTQTAIAHMEQRKTLTQNFSFSFNRPLSTTFHQEVAKNPWWNWARNRSLQMRISVVAQIWHGTWARVWRQFLRFRTCWDRFKTGNLSLLKKWDDSFATKTKTPAD